MMTLFHTQAEQQLRSGFLTWRQVFRLGCRPVTKARPGVRLAGLQEDKDLAGLRTEGRNWAGSHGSHCTYCEEILKR